MYYNNWYLSKELKKIGWKSEVINNDINLSQKFLYHGSDKEFIKNNFFSLFKVTIFYLIYLWKYDFFHFGNRFNILFSIYFSDFIEEKFGKYKEILLLKYLEKKIIYSHSGCSDGVLQSTFSQLKPYNTCSICNWRNVPHICSDKINASWGEIRNKLADYQITLSGNKYDFNKDLNVHEVPEYWCLDSDHWSKNIQIPQKFNINKKKGFLLFHQVGNSTIRTKKDKNIKCTHIYKKVIKKLNLNGYNIELISVVDACTPEI